LSQDKWNSKKSISTTRLCVDALRPVALHGCQNFTACILYHMASEDSELEPWSVWRVMEIRLL